MHFKLRITVVFILFVINTVVAQNNQYQFSHLDITNGLSHNEVNCIYKDHNGFMWFGTMSGLNRYDGYTFKIYKHNKKDTSSLSDDFIVNIYEGPEQKLWIETRRGFNIYDPSTEKFEHDIAKSLALLQIPNVNIQRIKKDRFGNFWFLHSSLGIYKYNPISKKVIHLEHNDGVSTSLYSNDIGDITETANGDFWIIYKNGLIEKIDHQTNTISSRISFLNKLHGREQGNYTLFCDKQDDLWMFDPGNPWGVFYYSPAKGIFKNINKTSGTEHLNSDIIAKVIQDDNNVIWVGTDHGGINLVDKNDFKISYLVNREDDNKSLCQNSTTTVYKDISGIIWIGTFKKGISYYHQDIIKFPIVKHYASSLNTLTYNDVNRFAEDDKGNLWIGTNGRGLIYFDRKAGSSKNYLNNPADPNSLCNNVIVSLCIDHKKKLWIGTYFGGMDCYDGKSFKHYKHSNTSSGTILDNRISDIIEDSSHRLWIATMGGGLDLFDTETEVFTHYNRNLNSNFIVKLAEDENKNLWIGTSYGLDVLSGSTGKFTSYLQNDNDVNSLVNDNITSLIEDSRHLFWITTRDGISIFNPKTKKFQNLLKDDGLPDNTVLDILEDSNHNMWLSTANGLCNVVVTGTGDNLRFQFKNFDETDGLQGREFNQYSSLKLKTGELIFGGANGFNIFNPLNIKSNASKAKLIFTNFLVFNNPIKPNQTIDGHMILAKSILETRSVILHHAENVFTIEFASLNYFNPDKVKYQYMLEGFDHGWLTTDINSRKATYTNLDAGDYTFKVRASNSEGVWSNDDLTLKIKILPPFYKSPLAYTFYIITILGILFYMRHRGIEKIKIKFEVEQEKKEIQRSIELERQEVKRMHELDMMKIKFLTNVSHEFRTPLSLIMAPVDKMLNHTNDADQKQQLNVIGKNAKRLLNLVNQLLDFRKMEVQELKLHTSTNDIIKFIRDITLSFTDMADDKGIGFAFDTEVETLITNFDHDKIERILFNLLSNAFKFTPMGGHVSVLLNIVHDRSTPECQLLEIKVIDTGIGIPQERRDKIFERFFQHDVPGSLLNQGSGIGLAITREFVKMHNGEIMVESEPDQGSCFIIQLPLYIHNNLTPVINTTDPVNNEELIIATADEHKSKSKHADKKPTVLLVEDNEDFRFYLKDNLKSAFFIIEASNGKEGWQKALSQHPDIMVSDISMPEMDGIDLCKKIKNDKRTSHIPVILLTALTGEEGQLKGLEIGANDYMTKPFNFEILLSKIKNLLAMQKTFKQTYKKQMDVQLQDVVMQTDDEKLLRNIVDYIELNILNDNLSVEELSRQMNMSRVSLYKKVLVITGKSPVEFIRLIRLKKALQLLADSQLSISQVSYEVGFNTPKYFTKMFKEEYGMLPSEYINANRKKRGLAESVIKR